MRTVTQTELRTRIRDRTQMYGTAVADAMLNTLIHEGMHALWDLLIVGYGPEYFQTEVVFQTVSSDHRYDLPADFYRLLAVLVNRDSTATLGSPAGVAAEVPATRAGWCKIPRFSHHDVDRLLNATGSDPYSTRYQLSKRATSGAGGPADELILYPVPQQAFSVLVTYVPTLKSQIVVDTGEYTFDGVHGWEEYCVLWVSIRLLDREESSTTGLRRDLAEMADRIKGLAGNRDHVEPEYVSDVRGGLDNGLFPARRREVW